MDNEDKEKLLKISKNLVFAKCSLMDTFCKKGAEGSVVCNAIRRLHIAERELDLLITGGVSNISECKPKPESVPDSEEPKAESKA